MKFNASVALFAVFLFGVIVSLNSSPMVPSGGETSGTSETSNSLPVAIRNYILSVLTYNRPGGIPKNEYKSITNPDFLTNLDSLKDNSFISDYSKFLLDPEFIARVTEAQDQILLGLKNGNSEDQDKKASDALLDITIKKINEKKAKNELKTSEFYVDTTNKLYTLINIFINYVKHDL